ncbi:MAG: stage V sporulation protein AE [Oscillospiraceae bacterium]|nr:stage V sporulation protein AE [Oscillospiraceae bacterium]
MLTALLKAFLVGGTICAVGQVLIDLTRLTPARILTSFVVAGVILSGLGLYGPLIEFAGAGASVPLTGFGHLLAQGVREAVEEEGIIGVLKGGMTAASAGITAALTAGLTVALTAGNRLKKQG